MPAPRRNETGAHGGAVEAGAEAGLFPGRIHAVRAWDMIPEVGGGRIHLSSISRCAIWPRGEVRAECLADQHRGTSMPDRACTCGFYGYHPSGFEFEALEYGVEVNEVLGLIEAWGRVEVHAGGIRAEWARVAKLFFLTDSSADYIARVQRAARDYEAELVPIPDAGEFYSHLRGLNGLSQGFVEGLLGDTALHRFEPRACGYISQRGQPVAGLGFVLDENPESPNRFQRLLTTGRPGLEMIRVAGPQHHRRALQSQAFDLGAELRLVPELDNPHDPNAIAVMDASGERKAGYVPRDLAPDIGARLAADRIATVRSIWQWRDLHSGRRTGLHVLVSPSPNVELMADEQLLVGGPI